LTQISSSGKNIFLDQCNFSKNSVWQKECSFLHIKNFLVEFHGAISERIESGGSCKIMFFYSYVENITRAQCRHLKNPKHVQSMYELPQTMAHHLLKSDQKDGSAGCNAVKAFYGHPSEPSNKDVGTLDGGYVHKVSLPKVSRLQSTSLMTSKTETLGTCYLQVPHVPTWSNLTRLLAGVGRRLLPFLPVWLM
jgi:hypothetical protein